MKLATLGCSNRNRQRSMGKLSAVLVEFPSLFTLFALQMDDETVLLAQSQPLQYQPTTELEPWNHPQLLNCDCVSKRLRLRLIKE